MKEQLASPGVQPRLNPFLFPSDTASRFILLFVALAGATLFNFHWLSWRIPPLRDRLRQAIEGCAEQLRDTPMPAPGEKRMVPIDCMIPAFREQALFDLAGLCSTLLAAVLIYCIYPAIVIRRHDLRPLSAVDAPDLPDTLQQLSADVGLRRAPTFLIDLRNDADGGITFGRWGRYYVRLNAGLVLKFATDRPTFDAVVRHELAHLRNADISMTYLALAGWWVFLIGAMVAFAYDLVAWPIQTLTMFAWRLALILLLVYWARNAILRVRELYADARAYESGADPDALSRVVDRGGSEPNWLGRHFGFHPAPGLRRAALANPEPIFGLSLWEAAAAGVATGFGLPMVAFIVGQFLVGGLSLWTNLVGLLIFMPFLVSGLGLGVWRETYASIVLGRRPKNAGRFGIAVGMGFFVGVLVSPLPFLPSNEVLPITAGHRALTAAALLLLLFILFRWIAVGAEAWIKASNSDVTLRRAAACGLVTATILVASGCYWLWFSGGTLVGLADVYGVPLMTLITDPWIVFGQLQGSHITIFLICIWAFPLTADLWASRHADPKRKTQNLTGRLPTQAQSSGGLRAALAGAFCTALLFLVLYATLRLVFIPTLRTDAEVASFYIMVVFFVSVAQAFLATGIAWRSRRLSISYGLCSAFIAGCLIAAEFLTFNALRSGELPSAIFVWQVFTNMTNLGAIFALPLCLVASIGLRSTRSGADQRPS